MSNKVSKALILQFSITSLESHAKSERADRVLAHLGGLPSRSQLKTFFHEKRILRGLEALEPSTLVQIGDEIKVHLKAENFDSELKPVKMDLEIFYEDADLMVLYKPKGISMHPGAAGKDEITLAHGLIAHSRELSDRSGQFRPGIVHRLDKDTEGIVVVAKNNEIHEKISLQFAMRTIDRAYRALAFGKVPTSMLINKAIGRHPRDRKKMAVRAVGGKESRTKVQRLEYFDEGYSLVECKLETGRTHQIRVHLSDLKFPLLGDPLYSKPRKMEWSITKQLAFENLRGQALQAFRLGFIHPKTEKKDVF